MSKHTRDQRGEDIACRAVRAARCLADEMREARWLFDKADHSLMNDCVRCLEKTEFARQENVVKFDALQEIVTPMLLQEIRGVTTTLEETYSDAGAVEYQITKSLVLTADGERLERLDHALNVFRELQLELAIQQQGAKIVEMQARH